MRRTHRTSSHTVENFGSIRSMIPGTLLFPVGCVISPVKGPVLLRDRRTVGGSHHKVIVSIRGDLE